MKLKGSSSLPFLETFPLLSPESFLPNFCGLSQVVKSGFKMTLASSLSALMSLFHILCQQFLPPFPIIFLLLLLYPSHPLPGSAPGGFGFPNLTSADSVPLYFSCITSPCFGLFYVFFLCLSFARSFCACINNWTQISGPMSLPCKRPVTFTWFPANCDAFRLKKSAKIHCLYHRWTWQRH